MTTLALQQENTEIVQFFSDLVQRYGFDPRALDWGSVASQERRFAVLTQIGVLPGTSVLDVGCGLADLLAYLERRGIKVDYTGYDLVPVMIEHARQRFPQAHLEERDLMASVDSCPQFDYVIASGIFSLRQQEPMTYLEAMARRMFAFCRKGVAFNTQSLKATKYDPGQFYADPAQVLSICLEITPHVVLRHDYFVHDFTVYLYKDAALVG